ncbi:hypothetical protein Tco_0923002 [Tanacetum coccineum]|uniref:Uncharacterized protein n=1 Tax=Tanacetum coccineum TaxID=301880 RepID=A0ABQ5D259_9ASTR
MDKSPSEVMLPTMTIHLKNFGSSFEINSWFRMERLGNVKGPDQQFIKLPRISLDESWKSKTTRSPTLKKCVFDLEIVKFLLLYDFINQRVPQ